MLSDYTDFLKERNLLGKVRYRSMNDLGVEYIHNLLTSRKFDNILEIGRSKGYTFGLFKFFCPTSRVVSIDIVHTKESEELAEFLEKPYDLVEGTSDDLDKFDIKYDLVLIDGDHSYQGCKKDWVNLQGRLNNNAIVMFDDLDHTGKCGLVFDEINLRKTIYEVDGIPILGIVYCNEVI